MLCASLRTSSTSCGCGVWNVTCDPPLKSIPRLRPRTPIADDRDRDHNARDREPEAALAHEVDLEPAPVLLALRAHERRVLEPAEAGEQPQHRPGREHGRDERDRRTDQEHEREALDPGGRDEEQDERRDRRHDVRVDDRMEPLRITRGDRGPYGFARTDLLFDAFEDDHVRVCCDSDREDEAGEAGQGQASR